MEIQLLGPTASQQHLDAVAQFGFHVQTLVLDGRYQRHAQRLAARQNGDLFHPTGFQRGSDQRMTGFVHRDAFAVGRRHGRHARRLFTDAAGFHRVDEMRHAHGLCGASCGEQGRMIGDVGDGGGSQAHGVARQLCVVQILFRADLGGVQAEQCLAVVQPWQAHGNGAVEAAFAHQRRVQRVRKVGRTQHQYTVGAVETVHLGKKLVDDAVALGIAGALLFSALADAVDLVDEDDARRLLARGTEQRLDLLDANAEIHRGEIAAGHLNETGIGFGGQCLGQLSLAGARLASKQHAFWRARTQRSVGSRIAQIGGDIAKRLLGFAGANHIGKADAAAFALDREGLALDCKVGEGADQQQDKGCIGHDRLVPGRFAVGFKHGQREQLASAAGVLVEQQLSDTPGLVRYPVTKPIVQADKHCILAQRGAADAGATQVGHQYRKIAAIGFPGIGRLLQGLEHAGRSASRRGGGSSWPQLPEGHARGDQQQ